MQAAKDLYLLARIADLSEDFRPLTDRPGPVAGDPLYTVQGVNLEKRVKMVELTRPIQVINAVSQALATSGQLRLNKFIRI